MKDTLPIVDVDPYAPANLLDPYPMHAVLRDAGPVVRLAPYPSVVACARYAEVQAVLSDHARFVSGAGVGLANFRLEAPWRPKSLVLEADPPLHTRMRAVLARVLNPRAVAALREDFAACAVAMVERCVAAGEIDGIADLAQAYPLTVFPDAVGLGPDGRENLLLYGDMVFNAMGPRNELFERSVERVAAVTDWIMAHCQRPQLRPGGLGEQIHRAVDAGELTPDEAPMLVRSFLSAGVDTTINGLGNALYCLARQPEAWAALHADPTLARDAFEEALRVESTAQTFFRTTLEAVELAGHVLPPNTKVLCMLAAANRDPRRWPDPDRFDLARRPRGHLAFGTGIHGCVGQMLARLEGELVLGVLARRVRRLEPLGPPVRRLNNTLRALASLPLRLVAA